MAETDKEPGEENGNHRRGPCVYGNLAYDDDDHGEDCRACREKLTHSREKNKIGSLPQTMYHNKFLMD